MTIDNFEVVYTSRPNSDSQTALAEYRAWLEDELDAFDVLAECQQFLDQRAAGSSQLAA